MKKHELEMREHCTATFASSVEHNDPYPVATRYFSIYDIPEKDHEKSGNRIHPWFTQLALVGGLPIGKGKYYHYGDNYTVDPVVITMEVDPKILLIQRSDNNKWAFPGGFVDPGEDVISASVRECKEETTLLLEGPPKGLVYKGVVADERTTAHSWANTTALLWRTGAVGDVTGKDDAIDAAWHPLDNLPTNLHGSHAKIIELAMRQL